MTNNHNKVCPEVETLQVLTPYRKQYAILHSLILLSKMERETVGIATQIEETTQGKDNQSLPLVKPLINKQSVILNFADKVTPLWLIH